MSRIHGLAQILADRAAQQGKRVAYKLVRGDDPASTCEITYSHLHTRAQDLAQVLEIYGMRGSYALLSHHDALEHLVAFVGCQYAGVVPVVIRPIHPKRLAQSATYLHAVAGDVSATAILTSAALCNEIHVHPYFARESQRMLYIATETGMAIVGAKAAPLKVQEGITANLSHIQYTSGSTAEPRGVMISHENLLHTLEDTAEGIELTSDSLAVNWMPHYHDMGLIFGLLEPIYQGFPCVLLAPGAFIQRPQRWLRAISDARATHSAGPNFAYDLCVATMKEETRAQLDLSGWAVAATGAEPVNPATIDRFVSAFRAAGFRRTSFVAGYGLAEATLKVTGCRSGDEPVVVSIDRAGSFVSCGRPGRNCIRIVDPAGCECRATGEVGEIWVSGPSVGLGYWNRPEETARVFGAWLRNGEGPFLRTGDLGFMQDGQLFVTGRLKDLIIIGGRNYYPQDIERTVERCHAALRPGRVAAFAVRDCGEERLVVAAEVGRHYRPRGAHEHCHERLPHSLLLDAVAVMHEIRRSVTEAHEVEPAVILLIKAGKLPTTSSGKVRRYVCRDGYLHGTLDFWSPPWVRAVKLFSYG